jgi:hypothetical protein
VARGSKSICDRCDNRIRAGIEFCPSCGYPTQFATHDQRVTWELDQYRRKNMVAPVREAIDTRPHAPSPRPSLQTSAAPALSVVREERVEPSIAPRGGMLKRSLRTTARPAEPDVDSPATMVAMRLLNARVEDLDAKVRELERELNELRPKPRRRFRA